MANKFPKTSSDFINSPGGGTGALFLAVILGPVRLICKSFRFKKNKEQGMKIGNFIICSPTERRSRKRVHAVLNDVNATPKEKCLFLNNELDRAMNSIFVSEKWIDEIFNYTTVIMQKNGLTIADFIQNGGKSNE